MDLGGVEAFARAAHAGQVDKQGRDYAEHHLAPIAAALEPHGEHAVMTGWLHDVLEDTPYTAADLLDRGVPPEVVSAVESVSKREGEPYEGLIARAAVHPLGRLVKLADNAHNAGGLGDLARTDPATAERLRTKYATARATLLGVPHALETDRVVDITTTGRRSGEPRRIEIWVYRTPGHLWLTGTPGARDWYANLAAEPAFTLHLKQSAQADLPVTARLVEDETEKRAVLTQLSAADTSGFLDDLARPETLADWTTRAPLAEILLPPR